VNFILQKGLPFLYGFFHLHKIFYTLVIFGSFNIFIFSCIKIYHNKNNKKMSGKSNIKVSDLNIPAAEEEKQNR
ncbi:hypothetical protein SJ826_03965, partial [Enterococcus faecium]|nr:hypothetical protein [Enterococcus faecium]MCV3195953.1 hypothetical protein [Enterococcus faecium]MCW0176093.1 hypothetical protein [Enterococcus faecium]